MTLLGAASLASGSVAGSRARSCFAEAFMPASSPFGRGGGGACFCFCLAFFSAAWNNNPTGLYVP